MRIEQHVRVKELEKNYCTFLKLPHIDFKTSCANEAEQLKFVSSSD